MITYVVHWVKEPLLEPKGCGVPIEKMLNMFKSSAGGGRFLFLTDEETDEPEGWEVLRTKRDGQNVMGHMMQSRAEACGILSGNIVFCDADTLVCRDLDELFEGGWSLTVPWYPRYLSGVILCKDLMFAKKFFSEAEKRISERSPTEQLFGADLSMTKEMIIKDDTGIRKEQQDRICRTVPVSMGEYVKWTPGGAYLVNFKGSRKRFMKDVLNAIDKRRLQAAEHAAA